MGVVPTTDRGTSLKRPIEAHRDQCSVASLRSARKASVSTCQVLAVLAVPPTQAGVPALIGASRTIHGTLCMLNRQCSRPSACSGSSAHPRRPPDCWPRAGDGARNPPVEQQPVGSGQDRASVAAGSRLSGWERRDLRPAFHIERGSTVSGAPPCRTGSLFSAPIRFSRSGSHLPGRRPGPGGASVAGA